MTTISTGEWGDLTASQQTGRLRGLIRDWIHGKLRESSVDEVEAAIVRDLAEAHHLLGLGRSPQEAQNGQHRRPQGGR